MWRGGYGWYQAVRGDGILGQVWTKVSTEQTQPPHFFSTETDVIIFTLSPPHTYLCERLLRPRLLRPLLLRQLGQARPLRLGAPDLLARSTGGGGEPLPPLGVLQPPLVLRLEALLLQFTGGGRGAEGRKCLGGRKKESGVEWRNR